MRTRTLMMTLVCIFTLLSSCGPPDPPSDCGDMCEPAVSYPGVGECVDGACTPTFTTCVEKGQVETCAEACAAQGTTCAANGCNGATYALYFVLELCEVPDAEGVPLSGACEDPIGWQVNESARCCCEQ